MCDEIDPKYYWSQVSFPPMRDRRLINADFFSEDRPGFRTKEDAGAYDLVVGNAPWGERLLTEQAEKWAREEEHTWPVANKGIGTLFLPKAALLAKSAGRIAMIQSAGSLLFNQSRPARYFRQKFFTDFRVEEVLNLSALRFKIFNRKTHSTQTSVAPACVITFKPQAPLNQRFAYISPKQVEDLADEFDILIEPNDFKKIHPGEAAVDPDIWSALMWGQQRDWILVNRLRSAESLATLKKEGRVRVTEGIIRGKNPKRQKENKWLLNRRILDTDFFPGDSSVFIEAHDLPKNRNAMAERPRKESRFTTPQLIIKQGWSIETKRFQARLVIPDDSGEGIVCSQSYLSVCASESSLLEAASLSCNSLLGVYFLLLTSGRFAAYRPETLASEIPRIPLPKPKDGILKDIRTVDDIDAKIRETFEIKEPDWVLIEDLCGVVLEDFKGDANSPGRQPTQRRTSSKEEPQLLEYCEHFIRVLKAGFGQDKGVAATIFHESGTDILPYRLVAFEMNGTPKEQIRVEPFAMPALIAELEKLNAAWLQRRNTASGSIYHQRVARIYDHHRNSPTIFIIKPDAYRYWTRSMGLHDADEVAADFARWSASVKSNPLSHQ
jgi:hypothetical protein